MAENCPISFWIGAMASAWYWGFQRRTPPPRMSARRDRKPAREHRAVSGVPRSRWRENRETRESPGARAGRSGEGAPAEAPTVAVELLEGRDDAGGDERRCYWSLRGKRIESERKARSPASSRTTRLVRWAAGRCKEGVAKIAVRIERASTLPAAISEAMSWLSRVVFPMPVLPIIAKCRRRSSATMPKTSRASGTQSGRSRPVPVRYGGTAA